MNQSDTVATSDLTPDPLVKRVVRWCTWLALSVVIVWQGLVITNTREKVKSANDRLFRIFHGAIKAVVMCDEKGKIVEYNKAAEEMFGWTRLEAIGMDVNIIIPDPYKKRHQAEFNRAVLELKSTDEDWRIVKTGLKGMALNKVGKQFPVIFTTRGIRYSNNIEFLAFFQSEPDSTVPEVKAGPLELPKKIVP